jgi:hypothetical protein
MKCNFHVGQKVCCVDDVLAGPAGHVILSEIIGPKVGRVYTVRTISLGFVGGEPCIKLVEIPDQKVDLLFEGELWEAEITFDAKDFRPVVERKTSIEIFRAMLNPSKVPA